MNNFQEKPEQKLLYKYYPALNEHNQINAERILVHGEIYFSCPLSFNDPFDCRAYELTIDNPEEQQNIKVVKSKMDNMLKDVTVFCLTEKNDNILMWSHYSTGHKGFCLEFKVTKGGLFEYAEEVIYPEKNEYPKINIYERDEEKVKSMLLNKSKDWSYEQERRIFQYGKESRNYRFPEELLVGVIFGCQMPEMDKQQIKKWVDEGKCSPKFYQAIKKENEFGLDIFPVE